MLQKEIYNGENKIALKSYKDFKKTLLISISNLKNYEQQSLLPAQQNSNKNKTPSLAISYLLPTCDEYKKTSHFK